MPEHTWTKYLNHGNTAALPVKILKSATISMEPIMAPPGTFSFVNRYIPAVAITRVRKILRYCILFLLSEIRVSAVCFASSSILYVIILICRSKIDLTDHQVPLYITLCIAAVIFICEPIPEHHK